MAFLLVFYTISTPVFAMASTEQVDPTKKAIILSDNETEEIFLFEEASNSSEILAALEKDEEVLVLKELDEYTYVEYINEDLEEPLLGYVLNDFLKVEDSTKTSSETEDATTDSVDKTDTLDLEEETIQDKNKNSEQEESDNNTPEEIEGIEQEENEMEDLEESKDNTNDETEDPEEPQDNANDEMKDPEEPQDNANDEMKDPEEPQDNANDETEDPEESKDNANDETEDPEESKDNANDETEDPEESKDNAKIDDEVKEDIKENNEVVENVDLEPSEEDKQQEATIDEPSSEEETTVEDNTPQAKTMLTTMSKKQQTTYKGVALKNKTNVYQKESRKSSVLKNYTKGSILEYRSFSSNWYEATVYVNGKRKTGYIHKSDVANVPKKQTTYNGIGLKSPTKVYTLASTSSKVLKSYKQGSILEYRSFSADWYEATVYVNGKRKTGYIHKSHVRNATKNQKIYYGVGKMTPTKVYQNASTSSKVLKSYAKGSILEYKSFSPNWYEATVYVNGKRKTGYIHKSHVENKISNQQNLKGIGLKAPTKVYAKASTSSSALKSYSKGSVLKYKTFTSNWYQATVYVKGKARIGYIHKSHVENTKSQKSQKGSALKHPTKVYSTANRNSRVLKKYNFGTTLKFKTFVNNWYEATVYINGKATTGYIHANDVSIGEKELKTKYNYSFKHMVDKQMQGTPKADGAGRVDASRGLVEFYANPMNFSVDSHEFFQFLVLTGSAGLDANEVNKRILNHNAGSLKGQAQAFINAGKKYNMNEAYLIAHALHETGNGKSNLALGIPVDGKGNVTRNSKGNVAKTSKTKHTVYNMYGYGAYDKCPIDCGAKYAFDNGWFSPEDSIIGGASLIYNYITRGQDTLYKMRWNPDNPGYPQYATHVQWATGQTDRLYSIYQTLDNYTVLFDVPEFTKQPNYKKGVYGKVATSSSSLNFRKGPSTNYGSIGSIPKGAKIQIVGSNPNGWYNIKYGKNTGWASAEFINLIY
ncbi:SH3 domain-containing protein [Oceanobacillus caeni]|uniref:SH3 domain-containing protein n=1 Tax=Oceanobacillus caeni TaxID=405946 RepID=UPI002E1AB1BD|nr:SH3 domain-containing protein [Oceanobacillus caeni]